jgi:hypothetical protein
MYLFEQVGLLTLDLPDRRPQDEPPMRQEMKKNVSNQLPELRQDLLLSVDDPLKFEL